MYCSQANVKVGAYAPRTGRQKVPPVLKAKERHRREKKMCGEEKEKLYEKLCNDGNTAHYMIPISIMINARSNF